METVRASLRDAGMEFAEFDRVAIEPTDVSFREAIAFAQAGRFDGYVSVGGGSVIDTAKAANLYATYPAGDFMDYVNAPIGGGKPVPGPLRPHIACPTTSGTGSECTGIAIFDYLAMQAKTGIVSRRLKPDLGIADPDVTATLPGEVVACTAFDVLSHALESYTARPYTARSRPLSAEERPLSQGANPYSDVTCLEALRIIGSHLVRAVRDAGDAEARERTMFAATLAGIGFGNAGCHMPHAMSYAVSGLVRSFRPAGYPGEGPLVPHGMSVIVTAPAVFRYTAQACPERHLVAAEALGADIRGAGPSDAAEVLSGKLVELMRATGMPAGIAELGFDAGELDALCDGSYPQRRLLENAPRSVARDELRATFADALRYW